MTSRANTVVLQEVGPREGFQFEGIGNPDRIPTGDKVRLIAALSQVGMKTIEIVSFVHPRQMPQMADAEEICAQVSATPDVTYTAVYLNDIGLSRAMNARAITVAGKITLSASEQFSIRNQKRTTEQDLAMQHKMAALYRANGHPIRHGSIAAAFGCNYEGEVSLDKVLEMAVKLHEIAEQNDSRLLSLKLADTMGHANPDQIRRTVGTILAKWPELEVGLHLHDTRGLGIANVYAGLQEGIRHFDTAVGGLGGCPFAGHKGAAGNVCSEEVVLLCAETGFETGVDLDALMGCAELAQEIVGHPLPSKLIGKTLS